MNEFNLSARQREKPAPLPSASSDPTPPTPAVRTLQHLTRAELLAEAYYDPKSLGANALDSLDDDRLREEVRWRRATLLREPALAALARLLSKVSPHTVESLSQGDLRPDQLIEKANRFVSGQDGVKVLKIPDRVDDHERRLNNLESGAE